MKAQIIQDPMGLPPGVFIPTKDWEVIKLQYPDIEEISNDIPEWQKKVLNERLGIIAKNPERVKPIQGLFDALNKKVNK